VEYAPYAKISGNRVRKDARQGTIDQDPDFIAFLESLTQPITKPAAAENHADADEKKEAVTTTPLVQYIKEKKANKLKESSSKSSKHAKSDKETKAEKVQAKKLLQRPDKETAQSSEKTERKSKAEKATKEAVRAANKQAANVAKQATKSSTAQSSPKGTGQSTPITERRRERGSVAAAAKILQRDLGLAPSGGRRKGGKGSSADPDASKVDQASGKTGKKETPPKLSREGASSQNAKGRGNAPQTSEPASQSEPNTPPASTTPTPGKSSRSKGKQTSSTPSTATQAFLKHANPSQGVTEPLLEEAFKPFGKILKVEIDKKKGFGYVDFADPGGLQKAIAASPVTVAQSQVVVLERKANPGGEKGRGKNRSEPPQSSSNAGGNSNNNNGSSRGGKSNEGGSGSSRGRGGRSKKGGVKGGGSGNANAPAPGGNATEPK
jgi:regulator of nonsense transcripts 3